MKKLLSLFILYASLFSASALAVSEQCQRIISLSPTITDTLLSLGLEENIVAGTRYDRLPKNSHIKEIGGMLDPNYEAIALLDPTIIFADLAKDSPQKRKLDMLQFNTHLISFSSLDTIKKSITEIGKICKIQSRATYKVDELNHALKNNYLSDYPLNILILYTYEGEDYLNQVPQRAAGKSFHQDILESTGSHNAYQGSLNAPIMSQESILMLNPDIIILLQGDQNKSLDETRSITIEKIYPFWQNLQSLSAIQNQQIYIMKGEPTFIASPDAVIATLKSLYQILYNHQITENSLSIKSIQQHN
ncbi:ABC transporter substrate-binding protein [Wohlfahrtiimonas larvae]|uniref:ABC transporter substrate-binding protein n=1 Tax=Wohlfahrtiimonas larvae TaxID=1157986 RepID=A0ABP9MJG2_9GAMM|nr:ABC transporter substrate-binding protein [Wohlfahrtiimonas larvae]